MVKLSATVVNWNGRCDLRCCIKALEWQTVRGPIAIVDHADGEEGKEQPILMRAERRGIFPLSHIVPKEAAVAFMTVDKKGRATLPEQVRADLGLESGDLVLLERTERGTYELIPAALVPKDQLWFHHPEMQARVAEAEAEFRTGESTRTETITATEQFLDRLKRT